MLAISLQWESQTPQQARLQRLGRGSTSVSPPCSRLSAISLLNITTTAGTHCPPYLARAVML